MKAVIAGDRRPVLVDRPAPVPGPGEVLVEVAAAGVNRADLLQVRGGYPPPPGATDILGLEAAGTIAATGDGVTALSPGDRVGVLLPGGGCAERVTAPASLCLPLPEDLSFTGAAALVEATATVVLAVLREAALASGERILVHGATGGIGTVAVQLLAALGHEVTATAGSDEKVAVARDLGAARAVRYDTGDLVEVLGECSVDVVLDVVGGPTLAQNQRLLDTDGRLAIIGVLGGGPGELDAALLLARRARVLATTLRSQPLAVKEEIVARVREQVWPLVTSGAVRPIIAAEFPLERVEDAHAAMRAGGNLGKVVLTLGTPR